MRVISTYDGIFIDTTFNRFSNVKLDENLAKYSNGEFVKIDSTYYLCQDNLLTYDRTTNQLNTIINTEGAPRFRRLIKYGNKVYALFNNAFGELDLETGTIAYKIRDELSDFTAYNGKLYIASLNSALYEFNRKGELSKYATAAPINDLAIYKDGLFLGTAAGLYNFRNGSLTEVIPNTEIVQSLSYEGKILFSNSSGLFYFSEGEITPLIENIEFNKMALQQDQHYLYAGSVNGLYIVENNQLTGILQNPPVLLEKDKNYILIISLVALIVLSIVISIFRKRSKNQDYPIRKKITIDSRMVREVIWKNPNIVSVGQLAEHLNTSVVQLNRHLKKEGLTGLALLKSIMKEIALEMYKNGSSLDEISKRVGYSKRYVKANFLKG